MLPCAQISAITLMSYNWWQRWAKLWIWDPSCNKVELSFNPCEIKSWVFSIHVNIVLVLWQTSSNRPDAAHQHFAYYSEKVRKKKKGNISNSVLHFDKSNICIGETSCSQWGEIQLIPDSGVRGFISTAQSWWMWLCLIVASLCSVLFVCIVFKQRLHISKNA